MTIANITMNYNITGNIVILNITQCISERGSFHVQYHTLESPKHIFLRAVMSKTSLFLKVFKVCSIVIQKYLSDTECIMCRAKFIFKQIDLPLTSCTRRMKLASPYSALPSNIHWASFPPVKL